MKLTSVKYLTKEGIKNIWVNRLMSLASVGVLVACMVLIGLSLLITANVDLALGNLEKQNVVMVYFNDYNSVLYGDKSDATSSETSSANSETTSETSSGDEGESGTSSSAENKVDINGISENDYIIHNEAEARALCSEIEKLDNILSVEYVSSEQALSNIKESMLDGKEKYFEFLDEEYGNPLSDGAKVVMNDLSKFDETIGRIKALRGVDSVVSQNDLAEKITAIKNGIGTAGVWIVAILLIISLVIVSNTIRVTMYNRKLEISIMKAVGATDSFIRIPFVVEGVTIGLISAIISEGFVYFCYRIATETLKTTLGTSDIVNFGSMAWILLLVFVAIGILAGTIGSVIMISKYLKKEGSEFAAI